MLSNGFCREGKNENTCEFAGCGDDGVYGGGQCVCAADGTSGKCAAGPVAVANPVSGFVKAGVARYEKNMVAAAEAMPAEKYGFKPSPEMNSFGHLVMHIAQSNNTFCAKIPGRRRRT